ncbi:hypothetical protein BC349_12130 [Flavihumibacter stibioxidans]|uniref:Cytochrome b561 domain-containing protein n=1 Tax=Flavihumibacter stibioxidans TaxID=1834163 RepID=A0ABR7MA39_9BACT|nr:hypothetical protein [Flavihumibacter stibioxidans]
MVLHLKIVGLLLMLLALLHVIFPRYFKWKVELGAISHINRQMMYVHTFFIAFGVFLMGLLCLTSTNELLTTILGRRISLGLAIFWLTRLIIQFFGYSSLHWRGKQFETAVHILFAALWTYLSGAFLLIYIYNV